MPLIISPGLARDLLEETGFDVTGHPDFIVHDPNRPGAADIEIRPRTARRMADAAGCWMCRLNLPHRMPGQCGP